VRGWHRFGIDWRPGRLDWLVDGVVRWRLRGDTVPRRRMYLVANLAVGGDLPGPPGASTHFPSALPIDWVRVWR
jgi:beta-glucanase (GH16 family)